MDEANDDLPEPMPPMMPTTGTELPEFNGSKDQIKREKIEETTLNAWEDLSGLPGWNSASVGRKEQSGQWKS